MNKGRSKQMHRRIQALHETRSNNDGEYIWFRFVPDQEAQVSLAGLVQTALKTGLNLKDGAMADRVRPHATALTVSMPYFRKKIIHTYDDRLTKRFKNRVVLESALFYEKLRAEVPAVALNIGSVAVLGSNKDLLGLHVNSGDGMLHHARSLVRGFQEELYGIIEAETDIGHSQLRNLVGDERIPLDHITLFRAGGRIPSVAVDKISEIEDLEGRTLNFLPPDVPVQQFIAKIHPNNRVTTTT